MCEWWASGETGSVIFTKMLDDVKKWDSPDQVYCQKSTRLLPLCSQFNKIFRSKNRKFTVLVMYRNAAPRSFTEVMQILMLRHTDKHHIWHLRHIEIPQENRVGWIISKYLICP